MENGERRNSRTNGKITRPITSFLQTRLPRLIPPHITLVELVEPFPRRENVIVPGHMRDTGLEPLLPLIRRGINKKHLLRGLIIVITVHVNHRRLGTWKTSAGKIRNAAPVIVDRESVPRLIMKSEPDRAIMQIFISPGPHVF